MSVKERGRADVAHSDPHRVHTLALHLLTCTCLTLTLTLLTFHVVAREQRDDLFVVRYRRNQRVQVVELASMPQR